MAVVARLRAGRFCAVFTGALAGSGDIRGKVGVPFIFRTVFENKNGGKQKFGVDLSAGFVLNRETANVAVGQTREGIFLGFNE